jgi:hypothetical protein
VPDWSAIVREKLAGTQLTKTVQEDTVRELAAHLEDQYEEGRADGMSDSKACEFALGEVAEWRRLARKIRYFKQEEDSMNNRTRNLWLPGLVSGIAATSTLFLFTRAGFEPSTFWAGSFGWLQLYLPWLLVLPLFGGLGAYLSRRAEGQRTTRLLAALFPSMVMLVVICLAAGVSAIADRGLHMPTFSNSVAMVVFNWVVLPGAALLIGALPFLGASQDGRLQETHQ